MQDCYNSLSLTYEDLLCKLVNKDYAFEWVEVEQVITPCVNNNWRNITVTWYDEDAWVSELLPILTSILGY